MFWVWCSPGTGRPFWERCCLPRTTFLHAVWREWDDLTARQPTAGGAAKSGWVVCVM